MSEADNAEGSGPIRTGFVSWQPTQLNNFATDQLFQAEALQPRRPENCLHVAWGERPSGDAENQAGGQDGRPFFHCNP